MENSKKVFIDEFQNMLDSFEQTNNNKRHNNYILMFITKKYKYILLLFITFYLYRNYGKIKNYFYKLLQNRA